MAEKFVLLSLDEKKSKKVADALSNSTSRKLLNYLGDKEASSTEISKDLNIPLSTVEYNLKTLSEAELIESPEFKWSPKGKQVDIYKVKKKYIVIAPGKDSELKEALKKLLPIGIFGIAIGIIMEVYNKGKNVINVPLEQMTITERIIESASEKAPMVKATTESGGASLAEVAQDAAVNVTTKITETIKEIPIQDPHYGLWFIAGVLATILIFILLLAISNKREG